MMHHSCVAHVCAGALPPADVLLQRAPCAAEPSAAGAGDTMAEAEAVVEARRAVTILADRSSRLPPLMHAEASHRAGRLDGLMDARMCGCAR
jgi:hypothetical protein